MLDKIDYMAYDQDMDIPQPMRTWIKDRSADDECFPFRIAVVVRINGKTFLSLSRYGSVSDIDKFNYREVQMTVLGLLDEQHMKNVDYKGNVEVPKEADSDFWKELVAKHFEEEGEKISGAPLKYGVDVSVFANGFLLYHGWELYGCTHPISVKDLQFIFVPGILRSMKITTAEPNEAHRKIIFASTYNGEPSKVDYDNNIIIVDGDLYQSLGKRLKQTAVTPTTRREAFSILLDLAHTYGVHFDLVDVAHCTFFADDSMQHHGHRWQFHTYDSTQLFSYDMDIVLDEYPDGQCRLYLERT